MYDSGTVDRTWSFVHGQELTAKVDKLHLTASLFNAQIQGLNLKRKIEKRTTIGRISAFVGEQLQPKARRRPRLNRSCHL